MFASLYTSIMTCLTHEERVAMEISFGRLGWRVINKRFRLPLIVEVRLTYLRSARTGQSSRSGSSRGNPLLKEGMTIGVNAEFPSVAALVLGRKALSGYNIAVPSSL